ncbi:E3 ubiquitin- ligase NRDP1 isoform X2 [Paramuricea clavata]|uniref:E3 ubiquitin- ligase NRDP1 isoform X2 n=1 Tax=Paramuricea clavata TaxID=317549 RepID=A0A6S7GMD6_PARCT|nr:E3 ubiquitin- ligase NRDP1 isoform X2 [Paramuricea clavata]
MAEGNKHFHEFGYPDERFESVLSDNLHCAICSCVLKDPVMCKNEHCFCRGCITKHLQNYHTCPSCKQDLTVESLADAPRIVRNLLSEQRIRCDHHERGCEEIIQLGNLASHVAVCGRAPVVCANEECSSEINREDQFRHESEECRFRKVKCRNCKEMGSMVQEIETSVGGLFEHVEKLNTSVSEQLTEMKTGLTAVENKLEEMENKFENRFEEMQNRFEKMENQFLNTENPRFRDGQHEEVHDERESARSDQATPVDPSSDTKDAKNPHKYAYVVAGVYGKEWKPLNSAEIFDKTTNSWIELKPMNKARADASSVVYNGQVLVTGGTSDGNNIVSNIEQFSRNANPLVPPCWSNFSVNLPKALRGHRSVLYNDRMLVIGGFDEEKKNSDIIYEIQPHFPFNTKVLAKLPSPIPMEGCGVVLRNDKILIFGGSEGLFNATAKVTMYDITKNEFKELAPLPDEVWNMATVKLEENVILVGGSNVSVLGNVKKTVISYNIETQKSTKLPPMKHNRSTCCAVVDGNSLVVMGGYGQDGAPLNSVEAFDFKTSKWSDLPSMKEARRGFIAEIV